MESLFPSKKPSLYYVETDRLIVGGVQPASPTPLVVDRTVTGTDFMLQRRELGIINIGERGAAVTDGRRFELGNLDVLYVSTGTRKIVLESEKADTTARFYFVSAPSHAEHTTRRMTNTEAEAEVLGEPEKANKRTIYRYIHDGGIKSSQLVMGFTRLEPGSVWNTMPPHTHSRRSEIYLYFDMPADEVVFHYLGTPDETKHLVVREGQAVASPSWSIHSGTGTRSYSFVWAMGGENQTFADMDAVSPADIK
jgi:4-deoxy-L-threo-5-hexosulose-uronate ketol-isomerase